MIRIEYAAEPDEELCQLLDREFDLYAGRHGVTCNYQPFAYIARDGDRFAGILTGNAYYREVHIRDLIVPEAYRHRQIGSLLIRRVEDDFRGKGYENINLSTYRFQAPGFYQKCGFKIEFIRENKEDPRLSKYFFVKYFD